MASDSLFPHLSSFAMNLSEPIESGLPIHFFTVLNEVVISSANLTLLLMRLKAAGTSELPLDFPSVFVLFWIEVAGVLSSFLQFVNLML